MARAARGRDGGARARLSLHLPPPDGSMGTEWFLPGLGPASGFFMGAVRHHMAFSSDPTVEPLQVRRNPGARKSAGSDPDAVYVATPPRRTNRGSLSRSAPALRGSLVGRLHARACPRGKPACGDWRCDGLPCELLVRASRNG